MIFLLFFFAFSIVSSQQAGTVNLFLVSDSTVADKPLTPSNPERGWGQLFPTYLKEGLKVHNHAMNGRSTRNFKAQGRWQVVLDQLQPGDYVLIEFGHNDSKKDDSLRYAEPETDYRAFLHEYINEAREKGAIPLLATPVTRRSFDKEGNLINTHAEYDKVMSEVADKEGVILLDLQAKTYEAVQRFGVEASKSLYLHFAPGVYDKFPEGITDNTHLSGTGALVVCDIVAAELRNKVPALAAFLKP